MILLLRERAGEIRNIRRQQTVKLSSAKISYKPDFMFELITGETVYAEAKGAITADFRIKKKLWASYGPAPLEMWTGHARSPILSEVIIPENTKGCCSLCGRIEI